MPTGYFSDSIDYLELKGSSDHEVGTESPSSKRTFIVDWENGLAFANGLTGLQTRIQFGTQVFLVAKRDLQRPNLFCKKARVSGIGACGTDSLGVIKYDKARVEATFEPLNLQGGQGDQNNPDAVLILTEKWTGNLQVIEVPGDRLNWKTGSLAGKPVGDEASAVRYAPGMTISLDIQYWFSPPLDDIITKQGYINKYGIRIVEAYFPENTLMFLNPTTQRQWTTDGALAHQVTLNFSYRPQGWQKLYNPADQEWIEVETADNDPPYLETDFRDLLPSGWIAA